MSLTRIGSIGINTGIQLSGVTTIATLNSSNNVLSVGGTVNFNSDVSIGGSVSIGGTLTYEDVTNIDSVGLVTARNGIVVGSGITLSKDGDIFATGVTTARKSATFGNTSDSFTALSITASTTGISELRLADTTVNAGYVKYEHSNDALILATGTTEKLRITSGGLLLLGTETTTNNIRLGNKFGVVGTTAYTGMSITNYSGTNAEHSPMLDFNRSRGTSDGSLTSVVANDKLGELIFRGSDGSDFNDAVTIRAFVDGNPSDGTDMPGRLVFSTSADGSAAPTERLRIESAGNVNIEKNLNVVGVCTANHFSSNSGTTIQRQFKYLVSTTQLLKGGSINELNGSLRIDFTPKFADSNLIMEFDTSYVSPNTTNLYYCLFYDVTNSAGVSLPGAAGSRVRCHWTKRSSPNDNNDNDHLSMKIVTPANNTTARTYTIHFGSEGAQAQFFVSTLSSSAGSTFPMNFIITEIAA